MSNVRVDRQGAIGRIVLARREKRNAIDRQAAEALFTGLQNLESDNQVRIVHVASEGEDFSVGTDLEALNSLINQPSDVQREDAETLGSVCLAGRHLVT